MTAPILASAYLQYLTYKAYTLAFAAPFAALLDPALGGMLVMFALVAAVTGTCLRKAVS